MGKYGGNIRKLRLRKTQKRMVDRDEILRHNVIMVFDQQVVIIADRPRRGILDGQDRVIGPAGLDLLHGVFPELHVISVHITAKILQCGFMAVCTFHSLVHYTDSLQGKLLHGLEIHPGCQSVFRHQLILIPAADRHHLAEQFFHGLLLKAVVCHGLHGFQLLSLPLSVVDRSAVFNLIFRHIAA